MYVVTIFPYVMMTILLINGLLLDGASEGIEYYLNPDFDRLTDGAVRNLSRCSKTTYLWSHIDYLWTILRIISDIC